MTTHQAFLSAMPPDTRTRLTQLSNAHGLTRLALHGGLLFCGAGYIGLGGPLWWLWMLPHGILLIFLFTLEHECTHATPFAAPGVNTWAGRIAGFLILLPFERFRAFHMAHHRFTNIPGKDPELDAPEPQTLPSFLWVVSGLPYWIGQISEMVRTARGRDDKPYLPARAKPRFLREARVHLALYALAILFTLTLTPILIWIWWLPALLGQPLLRLYLMAEHGRCPFVPDMFENTRTTFSNRLVRWLAWNMPYHVEHHTMPTVPFHKLPDLHALTAAHLKVTGRGYTEYTADTLRTLRADG